MTILLRILVSAAALGVAAWVVPGIVVAGHGDAKKAETLLVVAIIFGIINAVLRPIIKTIGCGLYVLTLGLIALVVNGLLFLLVSWIAGQASLPFHVDNFWPSAVLGALLAGGSGYVALHGAFLATASASSPSEASSNGVLTITATLDADTWALCGPGSSTPLA